MPAGGSVTEHVGVTKKARIAPLGQGQVDFFELKRTPQVKIMTLHLFRTLIYCCDPAHRLKHRDNVFGLIEKVSIALPHRDSGVFAHRMQYIAQQVHLMKPAFIITWSTRVWAVGLSTVAPCESSSARTRG